MVLFSGKTATQRRRQSLSIVLATAILAASCTDQSDINSTSPSPEDDIAQESQDAETPGTWSAINYTLTPIAELNKPIDLAVRAENSDLWLAERPGIIRKIDGPNIEPADNPSTPRTIQVSDNTVLDISDKISTEGEGGLLGIAFSPQSDNLYVSYTDLEGNTIVSEFQMDGDVAKTDERILFKAEQPYANHNGGKILFGPDGFLYIGLGDGGSAGDPEGNGQNLATHLGSLLRLDPNGSDNEPYKSPDGNPFTADNSTGQKDAQPEIWLYGLRNPWRFSFDAKTGDLWIADVGQDRFEEINFLEATGEGAGWGANLGWNLTEGSGSYQGNQVPENHHEPIFTYETNQDQCSVVGGHVYRGSAIADLDEVYLFSDFCSGSIIGLEHKNGTVSGNYPLKLDRVLEQVISLGQGPAGEIYVLEQGGQVSRLDQTEGGGAEVA